MKRHVLFLLVLLFVATSCKRKQTYTIIATKDNPHEAIIEVNNTSNTFTDTYYQKEITLKKYDVGSASLTYKSNNSDIMTLSIKKGETTIATVSGNGYMYIIFSNDGTPTVGGGGTYGSGSSSTSHICGYPTKDGTPCQRRVSGTSGYCWQHK